MSKRIVTFEELILRSTTPGYERFIQVIQFTATARGESQRAVSLSNSGLKTESLSCSPKTDITDKIKTRINL